MRIPFPSSIPLMRVFIFLCILLAVQLAEGTDPYFAVLMLAAQVFGVMAFNTLGGAEHVAGLFCILSLLPNVTVPEIAHAIVLQPGDYNLLRPLEVAGVCAIFYGCFYVASRFVTMLPQQRPLLTRIVFTPFELNAVSIAAASLSLIFAIVVTSSGEIKNGSVLSAFLHFAAYLNPLAVVLGTKVQLDSTGGRSAMGWKLVLIMAAALIPGFLGASKEGMLLPLFCWLLVCAAYGYRFTPPQALGLAGLAVVVWVFVYPYSQNARNSVRADVSISEKISIIVDYFSNPAAYVNEDYEADKMQGEFGESTAKLSIVPRYSELVSNGMLIDADDTQGFTGIDRYLPVFYEVIPHFLWPDRPNPIFSNELGHKAGYLMSEDDTTTGISIGSPSLFYDLGGWIALPVFTLLIIGVFFYVLRTMFDKSTLNIWGLMMCGTLVNSAGCVGPTIAVDVVLQFSMIFSILIVTLKIISYIMEAFFARQAAQ